MFAFVFCLIQEWPRSVAGHGDLSGLQLGEVSGMKLEGSQHWQGLHTTAAVNTHHGLKKGEASVINLTRRCAFILESGFTVRDASSKEPLVCLILRFKSNLRKREDNAEVLATDTSAESFCNGM